MSTRFVEWLKKVLSVVPHPFRWLIIVHLGFIFIIAGIVMLVLPGPGALFILLGFAILSIEFAWANQVVKEGEQWLERIVNKIKSLFKKDK